MTKDRIYACKVDDVAPKQQKIVQIKNMTIGIFEVHGDYYAMLNICPHRGGALCKGAQCGTAVDNGDFRIQYGKKDELIRCAWHGWEFDIRTGESMVNPNLKATTFQVSVEHENLYVHI